MLLLPAKNLFSKIKTGNRASRYQHLFKLITYEYFSLFVAAGAGFR